MFLWNAAYWSCEDRAANVVFRELDARDANDASFGEFGVTGQCKRVFFLPPNPTLRCVSCVRSITSLNLQRFFGDVLE